MSINESERHALLVGLGTFLPGAAVFVLWRITLSPRLVTAGLLSLALGTVGLLVALAVLFRGPRGRRLGVGLLLLCELPVAGLLVSSAANELLGATVEVRNDSDHPLTGLTLIDPAGHRHPVDPVEPHAQKSQHFTFSGEGAVHWEWATQTTTSTGLMFGYVSGPTAERGTLAVDEHGSVSATTP